MRETMGLNQKNFSQEATYGKIATSDELGRLIRFKRREVGVRQEVAAGMAGVGTKFLSQLENGKETAELGKTLQVLRKLGLDVYIFPRSADPFKER
jgi:transcriptional regulator with XRE-family HTH domain